MATFLNQLCREISPSFPNKSWISSSFVHHFVILAQSQNKKVVDKRSGGQKGQLEAAPFWSWAKQETSADILRQQCQQLHMDCGYSYWEKKIPHSVLLRGTPRTDNNENTIYQMWAWDFFMRRKPNSDNFYNSFWKCILCTNFSVSSICVLIAVLKMKS